MTVAAEDWGVTAAVSVEAKLTAATGIEVVLGTGAGASTGVVLELAFASEPPSTIVSRISFPLPQQALLVPQHHFADVAVPSHGAISPLELTSTSDVHMPFKQYGLFHVLSLHPSRQ